MKSTFLLFVMLLPFYLSGQYSNPSNYENLPSYEDILNANIDSSNEDNVAMKQISKHFKKAGYNVLGAIVTSGMTIVTSVLLLHGNETNNFSPSLLVAGIGTSVSVFLIGKAGYHLVKAGELLEEM